MDGFVPISLHLPRFLFKLFFNELCFIWFVWKHFSNSRIAVITCIPITDIVTCFFFGSVDFPVSCGKIVEAHVTGLWLTPCRFATKELLLVCEWLKSINRKHRRTKQGCRAAAGVSFWYHMDENALFCTCFFFGGRDFPHVEIAFRPLSFPQFLLIDTHLLFSTRLERNMLLARF